MLAHELQRVFPAAFARIWHCTHTQAPHNTCPPSAPAATTTTAVSCVSQRHFCRAAHWCVAQKRLCASRPAVHARARQRCRNSLQSSEPRGRVHPSSSTARERSMRVADPAPQVQARQRPNSPMTGPPRQRGHACPGQNRAGGGAVCAQRAAAQPAHALRALPPEPGRPAASAWNEYATSSMSGSSPVRAGLSLLGFALRAMVFLYAGRKAPSDTRIMARAKARNKFPRAAKFRDERVRCTRPGNR